MSRKNHNSVLFLTTLGVYLGLVLVGATPQVLAQAATTKQFNVRELAGARDDLDNNPDERSSVSSSVQLYLDDLESFIAALGDLNRHGRFDLLTDTFDVTQTAMMPCVPANTTGRYKPVKFQFSNEFSKAALTRVTNAMTSGYSLGDCVAVGEFDERTAVDSRFNVRLDAKELSVSVVVVKASTQRAASLTADIDTLNALFRSDLESPVRAAILANTLVRPIAEHAVIVTRLPRGSLNTLLASNAQ